MAECEVFLFVDQGGDYAVGNSENAAKEKYEDDIGPLEDCTGFRMVRLVVQVPLPEMVEMIGTVPAQGTASLVILGED